MKTLSQNNFRREIPGLRGPSDIPECGTEWHFPDAFQAFVHSCTEGIFEQASGRLRFQVLLYIHACK